MTNTITAIPTTYVGVNFRSRLEARYAAFFDLVGWKWEYEPLDLKGWIPDFLIRLPCEHPKCCDDRKAHYHDLLVEVKPYSNIDQFEGTPEYEWAMQGCGGGLDCDAAALFGINPGVSYWAMSFKDNYNVLDIPFWLAVQERKCNWEDAWKEAGNKVQWRRPIGKTIQWRRPEQPGAWNGNKDKCLVCHGKREDKYPYHCGRCSKTICRHCYSETAPSWSLGQWPWGEAVRCNECAK